MIPRATTARASTEGEMRGSTLLLLLLAVYVVNVALRLPGALQELPPYAFCDEDVFTRTSHDMYRANSWLPNLVLSGGINFYVPILAANVYELIAGAEPGFETYVILARALGPIGLGAMLPVFLMLAARQVSRGNDVLFWAAVVGTLSPLALAVSRIAYPDHVMAAPAAAVLWLSVKVASERRPRGWLFVAAGALVGISTSLKYSGAALAVEFAACYLIGRKRHEVLSRATLLPLTAFALAAVALFVVTNPLVVTRPSLFLEALAWQQAHYTKGHPGLESENGYLFYSELLAIGSFGVAGVIALVLGVHEFYRRNAPLALCLLGFLVLVVLWLGGYRVVTNRNMMLVLPIVLLFIAIGIAALVDRLRQSPRVPAFLALGAIAVLCAEPAWRVGIQLRNDFQDDARAASAKWVARNVAANEAIGYGPTCWGVPFDEKRNPVLPMQLPRDKDYCVRHYALLSWQYEHQGKSNNMVTWPNVSEQLHVNIGGVDYLKQRQALEEFLRSYTLKRSFGHEAYYGPSVYIFERAHACPV